MLWTLYLVQYMNLKISGDFCRQPLRSFPLDNLEHFLLWTPGQNIDWFWRIPDQRMTWWHVKVSRLGSFQTESGHRGSTLTQTLSNVIFDQKKNRNPKNQVQIHLLFKASWRAEPDNDHYRLSSCWNLGFGQNRPRCFWNTRLFNPFLSVGSVCGWWRFWSVVCSCRDHPETRPARDNVWRWYQRKGVFQFPDPEQKNGSELTVNHLLCFPPSSNGIRF